VVSVDGFNTSPAELVIVLPITSKSKGVRSHVAVTPPEGGLTAKSFIKCEDVRSIAKQRFFRRRGSVSPQTMADVEYRMRILMGL
jgi:mRNA interferase MazF